MSMIKSLTTIVNHFVVTAYAVPIVHDEDLRAHIERQNVKYWMIGMAPIVHLDLDDAPVEVLGHFYSQWDLDPRWAAEINPTWAEITGDLFQLQYRHIQSRRLWRELESGKLDESFRWDAWMRMDVSPEWGDDLHPEPHPRRDRRAARAAWRESQAAKRRRI